MVKKTIGGSTTDDLSILFNQLLGDEKSLDPIVLFDKYNKLRSNINIIQKILSKFIDYIFISNSQFNENEEIQKYIKDIKIFIDKCNDILNLEVNLKNVISVYNVIKDNELIKLLLITCKKLIVYQKYIENIDNLSCNFISKSPGVSLQLFSFSTLNFKYLFMHPVMNENNKKYVLIVLNMLYVKTYDIYNLVTSPDIDIDKFSNIIIESIQQAKKSIPRCEKAFKKISQSVNLLKNNFNTYYKDFIQTQKPTIIIEHYICDLGKDLDADAETTRQFKRIVMFYQKQYHNSGKNKDPRLNKMFETINEKFKILESNDDDIVEEESTSCSSDNDEEEKIIIEDIIDNNDN